MRTLVALVQDATDRRDLIAARGDGLDIFIAPSLRGIEARVEDGVVDAILYEVGAGFGPAGPTLSRCAGRVRSSPPLWLRSGTGTAAGREIAEVGRDVATFAIVPRRFRRDLNQTLVAFRAGRDLGADYRAILVHRLANGLRPEALELIDVIVVGMIVGDERTDVGAFASAVRSHKRTLERWLQDADLVAPQALLLWILSLRAVWMLEHEPNRLENVAHTLGFEQERGLILMVRTTTHLTPRAWLDRGGFDAMVRAFIDLLNNLPSGPPVSG